MKRYLFTTLLLTVVFPITAACPTKARVKRAQETPGQTYCRTVWGFNGTLRKVCNMPYVGTGDFIDTVHRFIK